MESNLPVISKRVWSIVRVVFFMLRKGISKGKLMMHLNLNLNLKRPGKLAGKAIANLMSHHYYHYGSSTAPHDAHLQFSTAREYEFSCSNTPNYSFFSKRRPRHSHSHSHFFACAHAPLTLDDDVLAVNNAIKVAMEMQEDNKYKDAVEASPALPRFRHTDTRTVRQLRVTDSPFPVQEANDDMDHQVDKAADEFIKRFYKELRKQA